MKFRLPALFVVLSVAGVCIAQSRIAGSGLGSGVSPYATDAYPGFDNLDDVEKPEKKEKSWFLSVSRNSADAQLAYAREEIADGSYRSGRRAYDALVREWPSSKEAPVAQYELAMLWAKHCQDYEEAFNELEYLLNFYSSECDYLGLVRYQYQLTNLMFKERKPFLGLSFTSLRMIRQNYESIVRRAPGAEYVPEAMLKIANLREGDSDYEEAIQVYTTLISKFPISNEAKVAMYRQAAARMWLCRRLAYNIPRCKDTANYLKLIIQRYPELDGIEDLKTWLGEVNKYLEEDAYRQAKFYDSRQRTAHAALTAWERFLTDYPESVHAGEIKARIENIKKSLNAKAGAGKDKVQ